MSEWLRDLPADFDFQRWVGGHLRARREALRLSQAEVAQHVGLDRSQISRIEDGKAGVYLHTFLALSQALGLSWAGLVDEMGREMRGRPLRRGTPPPRPPAPTYTGCSRET